MKFFAVLVDIGTSVMENKKQDTIDVNNLRKILTHFGQYNPRLSRKACDYEVTRKFDVC
jgi:hypothetical protein